MKKFFLFVISVFLWSGALAQFNDSTFHLFRYATTGIINRTNEASSYTISNALRFSINKKRIALNSTSNWIYGQQQKQLTNNDFTTAVDLNWYQKNKQLYYWGLGTYETSYSLKVNYRTQVGVGAAYSLVDQPSFYVNLSDGILYEFTDLKVSDTTNDIYSTFRNSFRFRFRYAYKDRIILDGVTFLQNSLEEKTDYIINSTTSVSVKLMNWISLTSSLKYNKVNRNKRDNLLLTFGVTVEKYF